MTCRCCLLIHVMNYPLLTLWNHLRKVWQAYHLNFVKRQVEKSQQLVVGRNSQKQYVKFIVEQLSGDWKNLRRAFKKLDKTGEGYLTLPEFRNVLKLANVILDEDDVYSVMQTFDEDLSGRFVITMTFRFSTFGLLPLYLAGNISDNKFTYHMYFISY